MWVEELGKDVNRCHTVWLAEDSQQTEISLKTMYLISNTQRQAGVRYQVRSCGICGGQSDTKFHQILHTHPSSGAGTIAQLMADLPRGLSLTAPQETN
jgi:hypothetical protein